MKRAKIMLLTIAVIATVGTALAFKVSKFNPNGYCFLTTSSQPATGACTSTLAAGNIFTKSTSAATIFYTEKLGDCSTLDCPNPANGTDTE